MHPRRVTEGSRKAKLGKPNNFFDQTLSQKNVSNVARIQQIFRPRNFCKARIQCQNAGQAVHHVGARCQTHHFASPAPRGSRGGLTRPRSENGLSVWILEASPRVGKVQKPKSRKHKHPNPGGVEGNTFIDFKKHPSKTNMVSIQNFLSSPKISI